MHMCACTHINKYTNTNCICVSYSFREFMGALIAIYGFQVHMPLTWCRKSSYLKGRFSLSLSFISWFSFLLFLSFFFCLAKRESFKEKWVRILEYPDWSDLKYSKYLIITVDIYIMNYVWTVGHIGVFASDLSHDFRWFHIPLHKGVILVSDHLHSHGNSTSEWDAGIILGLLQHCAKMSHTHTHTHTNAIDKKQTQFKKQNKAPREREMKQEGLNPPSSSQQQLYSQEGLTHGAGVAMHLSIWALDRIILSGAWEFPISHKLAVFTAHLLPK